MSGVCVVVFTYCTLTCSCEVFILLQPTAKASVSVDALHSPGYVNPKKPEDAPLSMMALWNSPWHAGDTEA